jgi:hypothetical protein
VMGLVKCDECKARDILTRTVARPVPRRAVSPEPSPEAMTSRPEHRVASPPMTPEAGRLRQSRLTDETRVWLATERDGLTRRMRIFNERKSSIEYLRRNDLTLGV